ncbi:MAG TPA: CDP-diacylglycerol--serine O-phosphatidyltransferase [Vicinamibacterales bacterium]|nr:CDP-diacylglycerol--serine O-phosphatidyltransferase [Vicinamibacterales bacterium]
MNEQEAQRGLRFLRRGPAGRRRFRRGVYLLPSLFTVGNMFCGYACVVYALHGDFDMAAPFIGFAIVLDMLDGRIARMTGAASEFGREFDSLADVISFGIAPAVLVFSWGLAPLGRLGWAAGFIYLTAAAMRLARFNIQSASVDKRYFVGLPSPAAAAVPAATVFAYPAGLYDYRAALPALAIVVLPALLMVSTVRFRSFKQIDLQARRPYTILLLIAAGLVFITMNPRYVLVLLAYAYLASAFVGLAATRLRRRSRGGPSDDQGDGRSSPAAG